MLILVTILILKPNSVLVLQQISYSYTLPEILESLKAQKRGSRYCAWSRNQNKVILVLSLEGWLDINRPMVGERDVLERKGHWAKKWRHERGQCLQANPSRLVWLEQGFSASALWTFWLIICCVQLFYALQDIQQHPRPLSSRYQRQFPLLPLTVTIYDAPRYCQMISPCQFRSTARVFPVKRKKNYGDRTQDAARGKSRGKRSKDMCVMAKVDGLNLSSVGKSH